MHTIVCIRGVVLNKKQSEFPQVFRGYDRDEVDRRIASLLRDLSAARAENAARKQQIEDRDGDISDLKQRISSLQRELDVMKESRFSGIGSHLETSLKMAEQQAQRLLSEAEAEAARLRKTATEEVNNLRREAREFLKASLNRPKRMPRKWCLPQKSRRKT